MFIHISLSLSLSLPPYWHRPCWFTDNRSVPRGWARLPSPPTNGRSRTNNLSSMSVFSSYPCILVFYLDRGCHGIGVISTFCFQDYSLRDPESIMKVMTHSNVVINLVGRDYETRYMCVCVFITWNDLCSGFDSSFSQASLTTITVPEFVVYLELFFTKLFFQEFLICWCSHWRSSCHRSGCEASRGKETDTLLRAQRQCWLSIQVPPVQGIRGGGRDGLVSHGNHHTPLRHVRARGQVS